MAVQAKGVAQVRQPLPHWGKVNILAAKYNAQCGVRVMPTPVRLSHTHTTE